uniref:Uncharacterized protein n=1 Tax=Hyaloperonospora arabidopsidis (strain Emoy2) TaxID=559515 RepID=M4B7L9_HYAAE
MLELIREEDVSMDAFIWSISEHAVHLGAHCKIVWRRNRGYPTSDDNMVRPKRSQSNDVLRTNKDVSATHTNERSQSSVPLSYRCSMHEIVPRT